MMRVLALLWVVQAGAAEDYVPKGSVASNGTVTTFSDDRVISPTANLVRHADGSWAGQLAGQAIDVSVTADGIRGVAVNLAVSTEKGKTTASGLVFNRPFRFTLSREQVDVRLGNVVEQYVRQKDGSWRPLSLQTPYSLELKGAAASDSPPLPQLVLAFIANGVTLRR